MDDLTGSSMTVDFMENKGEIKTESLNVNKLIITTPVRTPQQLFMGAFAVTAGAMCAAGVAVVSSKVIDFIIKLF